MSQKKAKLLRKAEKQHSIFWGSSYDRQLDTLLFMWPDIIKKFPDAKLNICYGWELFDKLRGGNPERLEWKHTVEKMMQQPGIIHWGRVGKEQLQKIRQSCGIWAYPTEFPEINCITALEAQNDGLVPVTMNHYALKETVGSGVKIDGDIHLLEVQDAYKAALIDMMSDTNKWLAESKKAKEFARGYTWENIAPKWIEYFKQPVKKPKVSVVTITIRTGFWNVMAKNLSKQTYPIHEWIIIDDYPKDRSDVATKYAKQYNLNIKYVRGNKGDKSYPHINGLVRGNNLGWKNSTGDLLVYLQDFIFIPIIGIEMLVDVNRHHPDALIAPVDEYFMPRIDPDRTNKEDWWNGETNVIGDFSWRNVRVAFQGLRPTENPFDFEMNYSMIPKYILDDLNGWWEFMDDGLGYDNTEMAFRALQKGYKIFIDDRNVATCLNLWGVIGGTSENILNRDRQLNPPRYTWFVQQMMANKLPLIRDENLDATIKLPLEVPKEIEDKDCSIWINEHTEEIVKNWKNIL